MTSDEFFQTDARVALGVSKTLPPDRFPGLFCAISAIPRSITSLNTIP